MGKGRRKITINCAKIRWVIKILILEIALFSLRFPLKFIGNGFIKLEYPANAAWCVELFLYMIFFSFIVFLTLLFFLLMTEINLKASKKISKLIRLFIKPIALTRHLIMAIFLVLLPIKIFLLCLIYKRGIGNYETIVHNAVHIEIYAYFVIGILCILLNIVLISFLLIKLCIKIGRRLGQKAAPCNKH